MLLSICGTNDPAPVFTDLKSYDLNFFKFIIHASTPCQMMYHDSLPWTDMIILIAELPILLDNSIEIPHKRRNYLNTVDQYKGVFHQNCCSTPTLKLKNWYIPLNSLFPVCQSCYRHATRGKLRPWPPPLHKFLGLPMLITYTHVPAEPVSWHPPSIAPCDLKTCILFCVLSFVGRCHWY